jgi:hypothetical protein
LIHGIQIIWNLLLNNVFEPQFIGPAWILLFGWRVSIYRKMANLWFLCPYFS